MNRALAVLMMLCCGLHGSCREPGDEGSAPVPFEGYCDRYAQVTCAVAERCDCLAGFTVEICQTFMGSECHDEVEAKVEAGRSAYQPDAGGRCLVQTEQVVGDCVIDDRDDLDAWDDACSQVLVGLGAEGDACDDDDECQGDLECLDESCMRMPAEGDPCLDGYGCQGELFCGDDDACHAERGRGEPCPEGDYACDDGLYCDSRSTTCEPYPTLGDACEHAPYACDDDLYCSEETGTCRPYPGEGEGCTTLDSACADDLYCDAAGICQRQRSDGAACDDDEQCLSYDCIDNICEGSGEDDICFF